MSKTQRPWWLLVNKPTGLVTTVREKTAPHEHTFIIRGEPVVQGLAWLTWGPVAALLVVTLLTGLAISNNIRDQGGNTRILFIAAFLILPALAWGLTTIITNRLADKHLQAERKVETQECVIHLNHKRGEFAYRTSASSSSVKDYEKKLTYDQIIGVQVTSAIGDRDGRLMRLSLDTTHGPIILLAENLGTSAQKDDLAQVIETALGR